MDNALRSTNDGTNRIETLRNDADETLTRVLADLDDPERGLLVIDLPLLLDDVVQALVNFRTGLDDTREILPRVEAFLVVDVNEYIEEFDRRLGDLEGVYLVDTIAEARRLDEALVNFRTGLDDAREILPEVEKLLMGDIETYIEEFDRRLADLEGVYLVDTIAEARRLTDQGEAEASNALVVTDTAIDDLERELRAADVSFTRDTLTPGDVRRLADEADSAQDELDLVERVDTDILRDLAARMEEENITVGLISLDEAFAESRAFVNRFREDHPALFRDFTAMIDDIESIHSVSAIAETKRMRDEVVKQRDMLVTEIQSAYDSTGPSRADLETISANFTTMIDDIESTHSVDVIAEAKRIRDEVVKQRDMLVTELRTAYESTGTSGQDIQTISIDVGNQKETVAQYVPHVQSVRTFKDDVLAAIDETVVDINTTTASVQSVNVGDRSRSIVNAVRWVLWSMFMIPGALGVLILSTTYGMNGANGGSQSGYWRDQKEQ